MDELNKEIEETGEMFDDTFDDQIVDDQFEEGESLVGEKYVAPTSNEKFVDVHKGEVIDKKDVSPLLQIKTLYDTQNIKIGEPKSGCKKCYGRGHVGFEIKSQTWLPCRCLFPAQTRNQREQEERLMLTQGLLNNTPQAKRMVRKWEKQTRKKLLHNKVLDVFKNKDAIVSASNEFSKQSISEGNNG